MRVIPLDISNKLHSRIQTLANKCNPVLDARICRPETPLVNEVYLERQTVLEGVNATDVSVAVTHPSFGYNYANTKIFLAYISGGILRVQTAAGKIRMQNHVWSDMGIEIPASACSIVLDGTMPKNTKGEVEFITEPDPWLFWVSDTVLYGQKIGANEPIVLAETNCTDVSAVRAMWSSVGGFDFGLVVFFILDGKLYYRQLIGGEWMDAEIVSFGPDGVTWQEVAAFRTWDYRVGVQAKTTDGIVYELFTQFMGIGKQNAEHIELRSVKAESDLIEVQYTNTQETEHVELSEVFAGAPYGGLYSLDMPTITSAHNVEDANGDWGTTVIVTFSNYLVADQVASNYLQFALVDSRDTAYYPNAATLGSDGKTVTLTFEDFNAAYDLCEIQYAPGTVYSMATVLVEATSFSFTPQNLNPPVTPQPEVISIWNLNSDGTEIAIEFTEALTGNPSGNEDKFTVTTQEYDMVPGGTLSSKVKAVTGVKGYSSAEEVIDLSSGSSSGISVSNGKLSLEVLSDG